MRIPQHQPATVEASSRGMSTSDTPIYDRLVREVYGEGSLGPLADYQARILRDVLDGLRRLGTDTPVASVPADVRQPDVSKPLPKRVPRHVPPPDVRQCMSGIRWVPSVPEARQPDGEPFRWLSMVGGDR